MEENPAAHAAIVVPAELGEGIPLVVAPSGGSARSVPQAGSGGTKRSAAEDGIPDLVATTGGDGASDPDHVVGFERHAPGAAYDRTRQALDWGTSGYNEEWMTGYAFVSDAEARSGSRSLRIDYDSEVRTGLDIAPLLPEAREYHLSYWVLFEEGFSFDGRTKDGGKLPGLAGGGGAPGGGGRPSGEDGYSARYMWRTGGRAELYLYHMDQPGHYGESIPFRGPDGEPVFFETGRWHHLVQRVRINEGAEADGEIEVWLDGEQVLDLDGLRMVTNGRGIDRAMLQSFHGGPDRAWFPRARQSAYFDDFTITTGPDGLGIDRDG